MAMQGIQVVGYVGGKVDPDFRRPIHSDKTVKSWARTRNEARQKANEMRDTYDDVITYIEP